MMNTKCLKKTLKMKKSSLMSRLKIVNKQINELEKSEYNFKIKCEKQRNCSISFSDWNGRVGRMIMINLIILGV